MIHIDIDIYNHRYSVDAETDELLGRWLRELAEAGKFDPHAFCAIRVYVDVKS